jgi:hypothetical protein
LLACICSSQMTCCARIAFGMAHATRVLHMYLLSAVLRMCDQL